MEYTFCKHCEKNIHCTELHVEEVDGATVIGCPSCHRIMAVKTEEQELDYSQYLPSPDQITYTIHCLMKQATKLKHAMAQVAQTITKLEVLRELAQENEKGTK
jgi:hypothetical protein